MKPKWNDNEIKELFDFVESEQNKKSMLKIFAEFAQKKNRQPLSVRNFYYIYLKALKSNEELKNKLNINLEKHKTLEFKHFEKSEEEKLKTMIENKISVGQSVRSACLELSNGDISKMLRFQNKYRNLLKEHNKKQNKLQILKNNKNLKIEASNPDNITKIYKFPENKSNFKTKLTDDDIKSLFMGLVNLVRQNAEEKNQKKYEAFLEKTEEDRRKHFVQIEQKEMEINRLNQSINELKLKNQMLNKSLENYRIDFLNNNPTK